MKYILFLYAAVIFLVVLAMCKPKNIEWAGFTSDTYTAGPIRGGDTIPRGVYIETDSAGYNYIDTMLPIPPWLARHMPDKLPDTTKVMMLVCDTGQFLHIPLQKSYYEFNNPHTRHDSAMHLDYRFSEIWWQFGYRITLYGYDEKEHSAWLNYIYLDENKKPLPKVFVVWISKQVK